MTTNTPKPELERWEVALDGFERIIKYKLVTGPWVLHSEAAAAIAKLTAERDEAREERDLWLHQTEAAKERIAATGREREAAEKRVKELSEKGMDEHIDNIILRKELNEMNAAKK